MLTQHSNTRQANKIYDAGRVQCREWMLYKIRPDHYPMNVSIFFELESFDHELTQRVIKGVVKRHEILRTTLTTINGRLKQVIHSPEDFDVDFTYYDIRDRSETEREAFVKGKFQVARFTPFNFEYGPLFRVVVFGLTSSNYSVNFIFHHLVSDEQSLRIFRNDISIIMDTMLGKASKALPDNNIQYREYAAFENDLLETRKGDPYRNYWEEILSHGLPRLNIIEKDRWDEHTQHYLKKVDDVKEKVSRLPGFDMRFIPSVIRRFKLEEAGQLRFKYGEQIYQRISIYREESKSSLLALLVGSLLQAFRKMSGQTKFSFEIPGSSRISKAFNQTMGWLTTGGPCYFDISNLFTAAGLLAYIDEQLYMLSKYCVYPPEAIGYRSNPPLGGRMPVFLTLSYYDVNNNDESGVLSHQPLYHGTFQDISFFFGAYNNAVTLEILYNNYLFSPAQVEWLIDEQLITMNDILTAAGI